jgi:putative endonuclease
MTGEERAARWKRQRQQRYVRGLAAERIAAGWLMLKGYRVLGRRVRTGGGEIDLIAVRGRRIAFVEVKQRRHTLAAEAAILPRQRERVRRAAELWLRSRPALHGYEMGFDVVFLLPWRLPRHIPNALSEHEWR